MKLLLVVPPNYTKRFYYPHLGIMYLSAVLHTSGQEADIFECQTGHGDTDQLMNEVGNYDTVGFYMNYFSAGFVKKTTESIRNNFNEIRIIAGGPYASYQPKKWAAEFADIVVIGEGEDTIKEIASGKDLSAIPAIAYRNRDGEIVENERKTTWVDVESLPFPEWGSVNYRKYGYTILKRKPLLPIMTGRGCPRQCIYCTKLVHGHTMRQRSVGSVVDEIEYDHEKFGAREIHFTDDDLTNSVERFKKICEEIIRRGLNRKLIFGVPNGMRPDRGDRDLFRLMVKAGFYFAVISVESADKAVSKKLCRDMNHDNIHENIRMARQAGLIVSTFYIFGTPFDTKASMQNSITFAQRSDANIISIFFMLPFPGTKIHEMLTKEGKIAASGNDYFSYTTMKPVFEANDWNEDDLLKMTKRAYRKFYLSPRRILINLISLPRAFSNPVTIFNMLIRLLFIGAPVRDRPFRWKPDSRMGGSKLTK